MGTPPRSRACAARWRSAAPVQYADWFDLFTAVREYRLDTDVAAGITTPLLITSPEDEQFWPGQSEQLADLHARPGPRRGVQRGQRAPTGTASRWRGCSPTSGCSTGSPTNCPPDPAPDRHNPRKPARPETRKAGNPQIPPTGHFWWGWSACRGPKVASQPGEGRGRGVPAGRPSTELTAVRVGLTDGAAGCPSVDWPPTRVDTPVTPTKSGQSAGWGVALGALRSRRVIRLRRTSSSRRAPSPRCPWPGRLLPRWHCGPGSARVPSCRPARAGDRSRCGSSPAGPPGR